MDVAEKIMRAKVDLDDVYEAGKQKLVDLHPEVTASGNYISVDNVSELPHSVACKISGVDNPETVQVTRCGRNLLNPNALGSGTIVEYNGVPCYKFMDKSIDTGGVVFSGCFKENTQYTLTLKAYRGASSSVTRVVFIVNYTDGTKTNIEVFVNEVKTVTTSQGKTVKNIVTQSSYWETAYIDLSVSCLYEGTTALPYEPYNGQTFTPKADGTVEGMTSVSPYMNIFTDNAGATLEATYRVSWGMQEERERFYNDFQQGKINVSISFEWLALDKANTTSVINALSATITGQTLTLNLSAVNAAFETSSGAGDGSTSTEFAALIATKTNWTIVLK